MVNHEEKEQEEKQQEQENVESVRCGHVLSWVVMQIRERFGLWTQTVNCPLDIQQEHEQEQEQTQVQEQKQEQKQEQEHQILTASKLYKIYDCCTSLLLHTSPPSFLCIQAAVNYCSIFCPG